MRLFKRRCGSEHAQGDIIKHVFESRKEDEIRQGF